jgi:hypothetical protein
VKVKEERKQPDGNKEREKAAGWMKGKDWGIEVRVYPAILLTCL